MNRFKFFETAVVLADRDILHFRCDDALVGIPLLGHGLAGRPERLALQAGVFLELVFGRFTLVIFFGMGFGKVAIVDSLNFAAFVFFDIASFENPVTTESGESPGYVAIERRVSPRSGAIIDSNGWIFLDMPVGMLGVGKANLPHGNFDRWMDLACDIDSGRVGKDGGIFFNCGELG